MLSMIARNSVISSDGVLLLSVVGAIGKQGRVGGLTAAVVVAAAVARGSEYRDGMARGLGQQQGNPEPIRPRISSCLVLFLLIPYTFIA
jgi:hypothetical protein